MIIYRLGGAKDLGGITWLSEELRGGGGGGVSRNDRDKRGSDQKTNGISGRDGTPGGTL